MEWRHVGKHFCENLLLPDTQISKGKTVAYPTEDSKWLGITKYMVPATIIDRQTYKDRESDG